MHHHVIHGQGIKHTLTLAPHFGLHDAANVLFKFTPKNGGEHRFKTVEGNVGHKPQATVVNAHKR